MSSFHHPATPHCHYLAVACIYNPNPLPIRVQPFLEPWGFAGSAFFGYRFRCEARVATHAFLRLRQRPTQPTRLAAIVSPDHTGQLLFIPLPRPTTSHHPRPPTNLLDSCTKILYPPVSFYDSTIVICCRYTDRSQIRSFRSTFQQPVSSSTLR